MIWLKLSAGFTRHPKVMAAGLEGRALFIGGLCYSAANLTDGFIPRIAVRVIALEAEITDVDGAVARLLDAGLWEEDDRGYRIHDYLDWQRSATDLDDLKTKRAEAGKRGGLRSGQSRREANEAKPEALASSKPEANARSKPEANARSKPEADKTREDETRDGPPVSPPDGGEPPKVRRKEREGPLPVDFTLTDDRRSWAMTQGLTAPQTEIAFQRFVNHAAATARRQVDWDASWRTWVLGDIQRGVFQGAGRPPPEKPVPPAYQPDGGLADLRASLAAGGSRRGQPREPPR